ncbi:MAG: transposase domain-containing protein [Alphaproteobacteria bacterium]|nr:transposase domain-containing protein [Alphaproteobacteria bacterium]
MIVAQGVHVRGATGVPGGACSWRTTLIESAKLQGVVPLLYLHALFQRLPSWPANRVDELTPMSWRQAVEAGRFKPVPPGQFLS